MVLDPIAQRRDQLARSFSGIAALGAYARSNSRRPGPWLNARS
jgi:hypothetical protein